MAITVTSRPNAISAAYQPCEYIFRSDKSPNTNPDEIWNVATITEDSEGYSQVDLASPVIYGHFPAVGDYIKFVGIAVLLQGGSFTVTGADADIFNSGVHTIRSVDALNPTRFTLDTKFPVPSTSGTFTVETKFGGGSCSKFYANYSIVLDIYVNATFRIRRRKQHNLAGDFIFDIADVVQRYVGSDLLAIGTAVATAGINITQPFYVKYAEEYDVANADGESERYLFDFTDDSGNTRRGINSVVPYVWIKDLEIESTDYDLTDYILDAVTYRKFLTKAPMTQTIGIFDSLILSAMMDISLLTPAFSWVVRTYDSTGAVIAVTPTVFALVLDNVIHIPAGTANLGALITPVTAYYEIWITDANGRLTEIRRFKIDRNCYRSHLRFHWLNSLGGIDSFTFTGKLYSKKDIEKGYYKRKLNNPRILPERETTTTSIIKNETSLINTGMIDKETSEWLSEIIDDIETYIEVNGEYLPVRILTKELDINNSADNLFNFNIEFELAFDKIWQRN